MKQLVELGKNKDKFKEAGAEVIAVFREEKQGEDGLKKIKDKTKTTFTLALDNGKKNTAMYSGGKREFTGYVIDTEGKVAKIFKGDLKNRAKSKELLEAIKMAGSGTKPTSSGGSTSKTGSSKKAGSSKKTGSSKK